eukprot:3175999-Alexandrium_andersonii.AAC.1
MSEALHCMFVVVGTCSDAHVHKGVHCITGIVVSLRIHRATREASTASRVSLALCAELAPQMSRQRFALCIVQRPTHHQSTQLWVRRPACAVHEYVSYPEGVSALRLAWFSSAAALCARLAR